MQHNTPTTPPPFFSLQENTRLEVTEKRDFWGNKKTVYRVVPDTGNNKVGIWVLLLIVAAITAIYFSTA